MSKDNVCCQQDLTISYGNIKAVKGISFDVREGEIVTLIGANGAGKSSTLRGISGLVPYKGEITFRAGTLKGQSRLIKSWQWALPRCRKDVVFSAT